MRYTGTQASNNAPKNDQTFSCLAGRTEGMRSVGNIFTELEYSTSNGIYVIRVVPENIQKLLDCRGAIEQRQLQTRQTQEEPYSITQRDIHEYFKENEEEERKGFSTTVLKRAIQARKSRPYQIHRQTTAS